ncbi:hypothetical protein Y032_0204g1871 [Ancylostoma ceylanicum]|uniref:Reverse transcriptase domain-containing protein n=1 Tax=Ancylostoma ceylanicum TaxID=53326 RepID=A0A016SLU3_9BILA|nr:hypothetical protein Y032_0204g1871 [Ancylostoma ceylanicum]
MEPAKVWKALEEQGVEARYTKVLSECCSGCTTVFRPFLNDIEASVEKGVRQGDPASPNLFSACLESVIRNCDWSTFGVLINGERLSHLRFADDIVLVTRSPDNASEMLRRLDEEGSKARLTINTTKTEVMRSAFSSQQSALLQGVPLEDGSECVYPGRLINMENDIKPEIARRGRAGWAAYNSIRSVLQGPEAAHRSFNSAVLPALCYASETRALTKIAETQLCSTQISIERRMLGLLLRKRKSAICTTQMLEQCRRSMMLSCTLMSRNTGTLDIV